MLGLSNDCGCLNNLEYGLFQFNILYLQYQSKYIIQYTIDRNPNGYN